MSRIHLVSNLPGVNALGDHLRAAGLGPTSARSADALLVLIDRPLDHVEQELLDRARQSVPVLLAGPTIRSLPPDSSLVDASGLVPGRTTPPYELRLQPGPQGAELAARLGEYRPRESWIVPDKLAEDVEQLLVVRHEMADAPICTWRPSTGLGMFTLGTSEATLADPRYQRLVGRWLRHALGARDAEPVRVGLLGAPDIAAVHQSAVEATEGLELTAVCDGGAVRAHPRAVDRSARHVDDPDDLVNDPELGLVVIATPANTHVEWARRALEAGKHVVVHPPICLSTQDADALTELASARSLVLSVYPEGRDDPGYRAMRDCMRRGDIGEPLWIETFAGGLHRPAGGWHDDERISGGLIFDRAGVHVDRVLGLVDDQVEWVSATTHKRVWHHVSNADHARILIHFTGGAEAQVTVSDVAATPHPGIHVVGTIGSLAATAAASDDVGALPAGRHAGRVAETVPEPLRLVTHDGMRAVLPPAPWSGPGLDFHHEVADRLVSDWPAAESGDHGARRVISVLEAARRSAAAGGSQLAPT